MLYGPFFRRNLQPSKSNLIFDQSLKFQNPLWGLRLLEEVKVIAIENRYKLDKIVEMPANNLSVIFLLN